jgi:hypothetical protein
MNRTTFDAITTKDNFAVAQVALYLFAILQVVMALMTATGAIPLGIAPQALTIQRIAIITNAVVNTLCFTVGYALLARCLTRCTTLVWRLALGIFLLNTGIALLAIVAQPNLYPVLTCGLSVAGAISVWNGRGAIRDHAASLPVD